MARTFKPGPLLFLIIGVSVAGCGILGGDRTQLGMSDFYNLYLPLVRDIPHPDSLVVQSDERMYDLRMRWSVNHNRRIGTRNYSPGGFTSFATLLAPGLVNHSLGREITGDLSPDLQERLSREQQERMEGTLVFDVHLFVPASPAYDLAETSLRGAAVSVVLDVGDGERYQPSNVVSDITEQFQMGPSQIPAYYRHNQVYFQREIDGVDILDEIEEIRLIVRMSRGSLTELWFTWAVDQ